MALTMHAIFHIPFLGCGGNRLCLCHSQDAASLTAAQRLNPHPENDIQRPAPTASRPETPHPAGLARPAPPASVFGNAKLTYSLCP